MPRFLIVAGAQLRSRSPASFAQPGRIPCAATSVLIAALSTAIAMMVSVGIMVGSFRETVIAWMGDAASRPIFTSARPGDPAADRHPTISPDGCRKIATLPGVAGVDRLRAYDINYNGRPVTLGGVDLSGTACA